MGPLSTCTEGVCCSCILTVLLLPLLALFLPMSMYIYFPLLRHDEPGRPDCARMTRPVTGKILFSLFVTLYLFFANTTAVGVESTNEENKTQQQQGLPQRAKQPVTSEYHHRSHITDHRTKTFVRSTQRVTISRL